MLLVEKNPGRRRRRGRRSLTTKQIAAGFGGKSKMSGGRRHRRGHRRNPLLASLANPRRHRRRHGRRHGYSVSRVIHRNPGLLGFDFASAAWVGTGMLGSKLVPNLVRKYLYAGLPATGPMSYLVRAGGTLVTAYAVKLVTKNSRAFGLILAGGAAAILVDVVSDYVLPQVGLAGMGNDSALITRADIDMSGTAGYVDVSDLRGYAEVPSISTMVG
jgi:hypothetical protein